MDQQPPQPTSSEPSPAPRGAMAVVRTKLTGLIEEYGKLAIFVYFGIFFAVWSGIALAIRMGWQTESAAGTAGTWAAAYVITKLTQPLRIAATLVITPALGVLYKRLRRPVPIPVVAEREASDESASGR